MRALSLVNRLEFHFMGNIARNAITLGDVDNDGCYELIIGNSTGEVAIFKGRDKVQTIPDLSFISCVSVGDILNKGKNSLVVITADGWCYIYDSLDKSVNVSEEGEVNIDEVDGQTQSVGEILENTDSSRSQSKSEKSDLVCIHAQRIPANAKNIVLGDIDNDGFIEMILGLTDRVVRSYRWLRYTNEAGEDLNLSKSFESADNKDNTSHLGKLVALNKWECANQIGSITLHHTIDGKATLLIAQPGGTFMRIRCSGDDVSQDSTFELSESSSCPSETLTGSSIDYQFLGISRMRNQNISTEILGDFKSLDPKKCPYAVATLDGTIMLVQDETILWSIAVDHQIFALTKLDVTGNGAEDIVVCAWDGQTYILDQEKNSLRFHLNEPVQAFHSGYYNVSINEPPVTCLVYLTFKNTVILYYDIPLTDLGCKKFEPDLSTLSKLFMKDGKTQEEALREAQGLDKKTRNQLVQYLLYNVKK